MNKKSDFPLERVTGSLGDFTDDAILITDAEPFDEPGPRIVWCNKAFTRMTGYALEEVRGKSPRMLQGADTDRTALDKIRKAMTAWEDIRVEVINYRKDGSPFWVDLGIQKVTSEDGALHYWVAIQRETTARNERDQLLRRTTEIIDSAPICLALLTQDGSISFANGCFRRLIYKDTKPPSLPLSYTNWLRRGIAGRVADQSGETDGSGWIKRHIAGLYAAPNRIEQRVDGIWYEFKRITTASGDQLVIGEDIENRIALQDQLRHMTKLDAMGQLTSGVAHDFNNILAVILGSIELVKDEVSASNDLDEIMESAVAAVLKGRSLTKSLLSFAKKSPMLREVVRVDQTVKETIKMFERTSALALAVETTVYREPPDVYLDPGLFQNALLNLLINARDASQPGDTIRVSVEPELRTYETKHDADVAPDMVRITITDTGRGIAHADTQRVIEPFFTTKPEGSGLGLSMVHGFVEQSGGRLDIESRLGKGTSVSMLLPGFSSANTVKGDAPSSAEDLAGKTIYFVEDDESLRNILSRFLIKCGAKVVPFSNGDAAVAARADWEEADLLLTDLVMPGTVQGDILARTFADDMPGKPVVLLSGNPDLASMQANAIAQEITVLMKPMKRRALLRHVLRLVHSNASELAVSGSDSDAAE